MINSRSLRDLTGNILMQYIYGKCHLFEPPVFSRPLIVTHHDFTNRCTSFIRSQCQEQFIAWLTGTRTGEEPFQLRCNDLFALDEACARNIADKTAGFPLSTIYPKKYAHGFVVLCFVVVMQSFIMNSHEVFIHIHQGRFTGTGAIVRLPQCQWSKPDWYGKISQCITTTKHSKAKTVCIFLGINCSFAGVMSHEQGGSRVAFWRIRVWTENNISTRNENGDIQRVVCWGNWSIQKCPTIRRQVDSCACCLISMLECCERRSISLFWMYQSPTPYSCWNVQWPL